MTSSTPRWDLTNIYPSLDSAEFEQAVATQVAQIASLEAVFKTRVASANAATPVAQLADLVGEVLESFNQAYELSGTIVPYISSFVTTDSRDTGARRKMSEFEQVGLRLRNLTMKFKAWIGSISTRLEAVIEANPIAKEHAYNLREIASQSRFLMSVPEEMLASELGLSGGSAWGKLQGTITSQLGGEIEVDGVLKKLPLPAIINLHSHPDEDTRRRGYELELQLLDSVRETLAACMNGVKGTTITLNKKRGREDALHSAIDGAHIDRATLEAMLGAMHDSFPTFHKYFLAKAKKLGKEKLAWWDVFAPMGDQETTYSFDDARAIILDNFATFSPGLADFARKAFDQRWIDAEQREGKRGGAFCMGLDGPRESRVLCNFDGTFDQVGTIAHELGHAFHNECAYQANKTPIQQDTPMTLAETASIMCETIVTQAVLKQIQQPQEELAILDTMLVNDSQVIVDIYSRYLFEKEVFERREKAELSVDDFCDIMLRAQKATYGIGLDENALNKYMWAWKPHYYSTGLSFYNFPYSFGLLFGIGLYAIYQQRGEAFIPEYTALLAATGEASAADLAERFGIDIRQRKFWEDSLAVIARRIERFCDLIG